MLNFINFYENAHQIHNEMSSHMDYNGYLKKKKKCWQGYRKIGSSIRC